MARPVTGPDGETGRARRWTPVRVLGVLGLVLHVGVGVFPYAATGLVAPVWAYVLLYAGWAAILGVAFRHFRSGRGEAWTLLAPVAALALWIAVLWVGGVVLGWTA